MTDFYDRIRIQNIENVKKQILEKKSYRPMFATVQNTADTITDYDTFPYPRWFRGIPTSSTPVIAEREAGWRIRNDNCYKVLKPMVNDKNSYPNHCFEGSCSLVVPCYPEHLQNYGDKEALNVTLNKACIVQYR